MCSWHLADAALKAFGISLQLGGTSLLIVVSVAIELAGQVDSQLTIRHHDGFLD
ncbi:MAG: hypothetical protein ACLSB9_21450 [Hydrogeniiclostridium mannosilyticum]